MIENIKVRVCGLAFAWSLLAACDPAPSGTLQGANEDGAEESDEDAGAVPSVAVKTSAVGTCNYRSDYVKMIVTNIPDYGTTDPCPDFCNSGTFAAGYIITSERSQGGGDDTALNVIRLECLPLPGGDEYWNQASSKRGIYGDASDDIFVDPTSPTVKFYSAVNMKVEGKRGSGDDTAANDVKFYYRDSSGTVTGPSGAKYKQAYSPAYTSYGSWRGIKECPAGTAICGLHTWVEDAVGSGDDTMLNAAEFACCRLP